MTIEEKENVPTKEELKKILKDRREEIISQVKKIERGFLSVRSGRKQ